MERPTNASDRPSVHACMTKGMYRSDLKSDTTSNGQLLSRFVNTRKRSGPKSSPKGEKAFYFILYGSPRVAMLNIYI